MSSILKALKKLEDEKTTRRPEVLNIDSDILRHDSPQRYSASGIVLAAVLLFAGGSFATYLYLKKDSSQVVSENRNKKEVTKSNLPLPQLPVSVPNVIKAEILPESIEIVPAKRTEPRKTVLPNQQKSSTVAKPQPISAVRKNSTPNHDGKTIPAVTTVQAPAVAISVPTLRVNGIAFQDGAADSVAVINGVPVSSGAIIEGAKVEVIQKDRVRFSYKGEIFDIALGKSNR